MKKSFCINLASKKIQFILNTQHVFDHLYESYNSFLAENDNAADITIFIKGIRTRKNYKPITNVIARQGKVLIPNNDLLNYPEMHFNIKIVLAQLLVQSRYILLHASAFIKNNKMYVMSAPSGTGKSTTCMYAKESGLEVVCDDSVLLKVENHKLVGYTTPYIETHKKTSKPKMFEVAGIYFLHQAKSDYINKQEKISSINNILFNSYIFQNSNKEKYINKYFFLANEIANNSEAYDLHFTKSSKFLSLI